MKLEEEGFSNSVSTTYDAATGVYLATSTSRTVGSFNRFDEAVDALSGICLLYTSRCV